MRPRTLSSVRFGFSLFVTTACAVAHDSNPGDWARDAVTTLGARDGYIFVFSPFNCALRGPQIEAINALAGRKRRNGRILTVGHEIGDSAIARIAVENLGIGMATAPFATSTLGRSSGVGSLGLPLAIALRDGRVIATLSGSETERIDEWIGWVEHR